MDPTSPESDPRNFGPPVWRPDWGTPLPPGIDLLTFLKPKSEDQIIADLQAAMAIERAIAEPLVRADYERWLAKQKAIESREALTATLETELPPSKRPRL